MDRNIFFNIHAWLTIDIDNGNMYCTVNVIG